MVLLRGRDRPPAHQTPHGAIRPHPAGMKDPTLPPHRGDESRRSRVECLQACLR
jgi:hypothetical protein